MKMKRIAAAVISTALCLSTVLTGCGQENAAAGSADSQKADAQAAAGAQQLTFTSSANANETQGKFVQKFCDTVTELTDGAVTFKIYYGGTLCGEEEELQYIQNGSVDMAAIAHTDFADDLTYLQFPYALVTDQDNLLNYYNSILFENPETSKLIEDEAAQQGVKLLGFMYCGQGAFVSRTPATSLHDLEGKKFGCVIPGAWEDYGVSLVNLVPPDIYDALSRGVVDASCCSFAPCYEMCWYEVADYWMLYGDLSVGNPLTINLDTWNSLSQQEQEAFQQAAKTALEDTVTLNNDIENGYIQDLKDRGCTVTTVTGEDQQFYSEHDFRLNARNGLEFAAKNGKIDNMKTIISACAEYTGIDVSDILAEY